MSMRGFTLLETILYFAIFSIIMTGAIASALAIGETSSRTDVAARIADEGTFLLQRLRTTIEYADAIQLPAPNEQGSHLTLTLRGNEMAFYEQEGVLIERRQEISAPLTDERITVSGLRFARGHDGQASSSSPEAITVSFMLSARDMRGALMTEDFTQTLHPINFP